MAGSVHALKPAQLPLPVEYGQALAEARRVAFEVDIDTALSPESSRYLLQPFRLPAGVRLQQTLRPEVWALWQNKLAQKGLPQNLFEEFDAALASILLPLTVIQMEGYGDGIDVLLHRQAKRTGKAIEALETQAVQRDALKTLKKMDGNLVLETMLADLDDPKKHVSLMVAAVYAGDTETMAGYLADLNQPEFAHFYQALVVDRNRAWVPQIERWLRDVDSGPTLVVVGALHLVGPDSVLAMLAEKGYQVRPY